jgi:tRNA threonylcarbamoyladenosine biosynthesis protein TsaE
MIWDKEYQEGKADQIAKDLIKLIPDYRIFLFSGDLGAGKTTTIKEMSRLLGVNHEMGSPSFGLVNEYDAEGVTIYHFDLYRLKSSGEALDIGLQDYLDSGAVCLIEWPEIANEIFDGYETVRVRIEAKSEMNRRIFVTT